MVESVWMHHDVHVKIFPWSLECIATVGCLRMMQMYYFLFRRSVN